MVKLTETGKVIADALQEQVFKGNDKHDPKTGQFAPKEGGDSGSASGDQSHAQEKTAMFDRHREFDKKWGDLEDKHYRQKQELAAAHDKAKLNAQNPAQQKGLYNQYQNSLADMNARHINERQALKDEETKARNVTTASSNPNVTPKETPAQIHERHALEYTNLQNRHAREKESMLVRHRQEKADSGKVD